MNTASRIIIVDDEQRFLESQKVLLEADGFQVEIVNSGLKAAEYFRYKRFDLYIFDINIPKMNGFELMKALFGIDPDAVVIMMTGDVSVDTAITSMKLGAYDYLKKPFGYEDLLKTINNALDKKRLIIENKAYSYRLQLTEKFYQSMVHHSPDIIYVLGPAGRFTFVNQAFERILGYTRKDLIGKSYKVLLYDEDLERSEWYFNDKRTGERAEVGIELKLKKSKKKIKSEQSSDPFVVVELKATGVYDRPIGENGKKFLGTYGVARDMTYRKQLEYQLRQAQKMDAIGTLAGGIAHDFNNILMGIQGYSSLLLRGVRADEPDYKKLINIDNYVRSGAELTRQLLDFASDCNYNVKPMNLNNIIKKTVSMFSRTKKEIKVHLDICKELWSSEIDEGQIEQVLLNLYVNSWQAMAHGRGDIFIKSENVTVMRFEAQELGVLSGNYVKISVRDNGVGMTEDTLNRVFEPFFTTKKKASGTGLGLASAYGIIKSHSGAFKVISKEGMGSLFSFYLPSTTKKIVYEIIPPKEVVPGKETVLLIDDEENIVEVTSEMLETMGYKVISAMSGNEAINVFKKNRNNIDILILDVIMPDMSGIETFDHIKNIRSDVKILLSSGYNREGAIDKLIKKGCDGFIQKPFNIEQLSEKISSICQR